MDGVSVFERRTMTVIGVVFGLLSSCTQRQNCVVDKSCANQLTFELNLEGLSTGSYQLELTDLSPIKEDLVCDFEVDANGSVDVEWTLGCPATHFLANESSQVELTLPINPRTVTIKFLHEGQELFAEAGFSPDYKFGDGCDVCEYAIVEIEPTFVE